MISAYEEIAKRKTTVIQVSDEAVNYSTKKATSITGSMFDDSNPGDLLVYRRYTDGHNGDEYGEYALIPYQLINSSTALYLDNEDESPDKEWKYAIPIGISIGGRHILSMDEDIQPWAGDVYTGLYNTNYCWEQDYDNIIDDETSITAVPWLSEKNGYDNTKKVLWMIYDNMSTKNYIVVIELNSVEQAKLLYNNIIEYMISYGYTEGDAKNIFSTNENTISLLDIRYKSLLYDFVVDKPEYDLSKEKLDVFFNEYKNDDNYIPNNDYEDMTSIIWKETTSNNNIYINQNAEAKPLTIRYEYKKLDSKNLGNLFVSDNILYENNFEKKNPVFSKSTNAFVYANQYNTVGTTKGDWYLGSKQEMQNLENYDVIKVLNNVISTVSDKLPLIETVENPNYLTSSQAWYNTNYCYSIYTYYRYVTAINKIVNCRVRLMLNIPDDNDIQILDK